ncbi:FAD-dependent monooxygenase [Nocardia sp. NPDC004068]|uniref:FAD-dependent monooxygenase n=1 Tax=Nocardia sp. NPDC004068 TaxID=3364303 RepID=UPI00368488CA
MSRTSTPVLIVGAGPAGLSAAIELTRWGVPVDVIDSAEESNPQSKAFTIQPLTAEWLSSIGLSDDFQERCVRMRSMDYRFANKTDKIARLDFEALADTRHRYVMAIPQSTTEALMRGWLSAHGVTVRWGTTLRHARQDPEGVTAVLSRSDGTTTEVRTEWLIGSDGLRSTVRGLLGLKFEGTTYAGRTRMMDAPVADLKLDGDRIHYLIDEAGMLLLSRLPGDTYRVLLSEPGGTAPTDRVIAQAEFQRVLDRHTIGASIGRPVSTSIFTIWRRDCPGYRRERIFLAGDAAHIHSIAGGLGLNAGVQDGINLGWKLGLVAMGSARPSLLDTYEQERLPLDAQVMTVADKLHRILMDHSRPLADRIALVEEPHFLETATSRIAGLGYTYRDVVEAAPDAPALADLAAGDRAPDVPLEPRGHARVHDLLNKNTGYTLLTLHRSQPEPATLALIDRIQRRYRGRVHPVTLHTSTPAACGAGSGSRPAPPNVHTVYGAPDTDVACLIRPDGYLAGRVPISRQDALLTHLEAVLT